MKAVIMAGGKGTRIRSVASDIPKPMIPLDGMPVLEREINSLVRQGFREIILTVGYLRSVIMNYFGNGDKFGASISYYEENEPLGNAGALLKLQQELSEPFLLLNGDAVFDINFMKMIEYHNKHNGLATIMTHPNDHPYDSGLIITDTDSSVKQWLTKEDVRPKYYHNRVNAGIHIIDPKVFDHIKVNGEKIDLDRDILKPLSGEHLVFCYDSPEYAKDMGTPERFFQIKKECETGIIQKKNLLNKQKAIFLDRDGTINKYIGHLSDINDFELLPGVADVIRKINQSEYLCVVVTNQPVVARGELSFEELDEIHKKMETLLGADGAYIDKIYFCPHHPDKGFPGEIPELKLDCKCRKPKPGMLLKAAQEYNIDLSQSWMIGDSERDILAGKTAGCKTILIGNGNKNYGQQKTVSALRKINLEDLE